MLTIRFLLLLARDMCLPLSVCLVFHNNGRIFFDVLERLFHLSRVHDLDCIYVLDSGSSSDPVPEYNSPDYLGISLDITRSRANLGYASGNNLLIRKVLGSCSEHTLLLLMNPDIFFVPDVVISLVDIHKARPSLFAASPMPHNSHKIEYISPSMVLKTFLNKRFLSTNTYLVSVCGKPCLSTVFLSGAMIMFKARLLSDSELFDERFFMYLEEIDLFYRMRLRGLESLISIEDAFVHNEGQALYHPRKIYYTTRNALLMARNLSISLLIPFVLGRFVKPFFVLGIYFVRTKSFACINASIMGFRDGLLCKTGIARSYH
jgi:GT2 family glycosyltransferase